VPGLDGIFHLLINILKIQSFFLRPGFSKPSIPIKKIELNGTKLGE
jgi:hypothetical protein